MNKVNKHIELGLTQEELSAVVKSTGDEGVINKFGSKLDNCDLSRPAIELVNSEDLESILKISNGINDKYLGNNTSGYLKKTILGVIALLGILGSVFVLNNANKTEVLIVEQNNVSLQQKTDLVIETNEVISEPLSELKIEKPSKETVLERIPEKSTKKNVFIMTDSVNIDSVELDVLSVDKPNEEVEKKSVEKTEENPVDIKYTKAPRIVRGVLVTGMIDPKYKGDNYKISNLVDFQGGNDKLQKEIFRRLKSRIKDDDIPSSSSTIVFNFEVTSRGKVRKVSVQSRTTPELETIIVQTIEGLYSWKKGSKRASKNYSVFVTFK